jgi:hypothetical protein
VGHALATIAPGPARTTPRSLDLAEELRDDHHGQLSTWHVGGYAEPIEVLYYAPT